MTITQFRINASLRSHLDEALKNPGLIAALEAIETSCIPRGYPAAIPGVHLDAVTVHRHHHLVGRASAVSLLRDMIYPPQPTQKDPYEGEWGSNTEDQEPTP